MDTYGICVISEVPQREEDPIGPRQLFWPTLAIHPFGGARLPEGWKTLFSRGFCKLIPVVFGIASTSLVVKMAENVFRKLFLGHFGQTLACWAKSQFGAPIRVPKVCEYACGNTLFFDYVKEGSPVVVCIELKSSKFGQKTPIGVEIEGETDVADERSRELICEQVRAKPAVGVVVEAEIEQVRAKTTRRSGNRSWNRPSSGKNHPSEWKQKLKSSKFGAGEDGNTNCR